MAIPPRYDKWIIFGCTFVVTRVGYFPGHGFYRVPFSDVEDWIYSGVITGLTTISFIIVTACARWLSSRVRLRWLSEHRRALVNSIFIVLIAATYLPWLSPTVGTGRILIPASEDRH